LPVARFVFSRQDFSTPRRPAPKRPIHLDSSAPRRSIFFFISLRRYFFTSYFPLSFRTVFSHAPGSAFSDISIQFLAYY
jgi:hypothetical protein